MTRWFLFFLIFLLGLSGGLFYGWVINPVRYVDTTPASLRVDYRTDYVLMVAEVYRVENDLSLAVQRLALLGDTPPIELVRQAMIFGSQYGYADTDLGLLNRLAGDLQTWNPLLGVQSP